MGLEILATTVGVAVLMGVLPRALFALRLGRAEGLSQPAALVLLLATGVLAVWSSSLGNVPGFVANAAAAGASASFLMLHERCEAIQAERRAISDRLRNVRPAPRRGSMVAVLKERR